MSELRTIFGGESYTHSVRVPEDSRGEPFPLVVYLHGWGGDASEAASFAETAAADREVATVSVQGVGPAGWRSWNGAGTVESPGPMGETCAPGSPDYCYDDCVGDGGSCGDGCWWTTCQDSVAHVLAALDAAVDAVCVDLDRVWAMGCSNGGIFVHELLGDARAAGTFAGAATLVGAPHAGFARRPASPAHLIGLWGSRDTTVPPYSNTANADVALDTAYVGGWYYHTARNTTATWSAFHGGPETPTGAYAPGDAASTCVSYDAPTVDVDVVECVFDGGHVCSAGHSTVLDFVATRALVSATAAPSAAAPTSPPSDAPSSPKAADATPAPSPMSM